jgi:MinD-like ATPase involved in chromosome partitioning or flagellar assembly
VKNERHPNYKLFRDRYVIWAYDIKGGSGKSEFIKYLCVGQKDLVVKKLPISSVTQLVSAVADVTKKHKVDVFVIDDTRTKGKDTNFDDMFEVIETIKNGHVISSMYGKYTESLFKRPMVVFFTNTEPREYAKNLSADRWYPMEIENNNIIATHISGTPLAHIQIAQEVQKIIADRAVASSSIQE